MCSSICKCIGCKNFEESPERKTLMHLADAAEVRVQQQTAAKTKLSSQISDLLMRTTPVISSGGGRYCDTYLSYNKLQEQLRNNYMIVIGIITQSPLMNSEFSLCATVLMLLTKTMIKYVWQRPFFL